MENKLQNFGKAIYLGADPMVAVIEGVKTFNYDNLDGWNQIDNKIELDFNSQLRKEHLDLDLLKNTFKAPPTSCRLVKLMPQNRLELNENEVKGILCLKEYPSGGLIEIINLDKVWSQKGILICAGIPSRIIIHGAITESVYLIFTF